MKKFLNNKTLLPTENEFQQLDERSIAQAESCASIRSDLAAAELTDLF